MGTTVVRIRRWSWVSCSLLAVSMLLATPLSVSAAQSLNIDPIALTTVAVGEKVRISATVNNDQEANDTLSYQWQQTSGTSVSLRNQFSDTLRFTAPNQVGMLNFTVLVSDGVSQQVGTAKVKVIEVDPISSPTLVAEEVLEPVRTSNLQSPLANAGNDQSVSAGDHVVLDGSTSSDVDSLALTYSWQQIEGPAVVFAPTKMSTSFIAPPVTSPTAVTFQLEVSDGTYQGTDTVRVIVSPGEDPVPSVGIVSSEPELVAPIESVPSLPLDAIRRLDILKQSQASCFPNRPTSHKQDLSNLNRLLNLDAQEMPVVGVTRIMMIRDVLVLCDLLPWSPADITATSSGFADIDEPGSESQLWWPVYAGYARDHRLLPVQANLEPLQIVTAPELTSFLQLVAGVKASAVDAAVPVVASVVAQNSTAAPMPTPTAAPAENSAALASVVSAAPGKPNPFLFGILFLTGVSCVAYGLWAGASKKQEKNLITIVSPHHYDR
ncbi:hypothetical protein KBB08_02705 [Candidatus Gracilibacteria bacterium]|nr:hypothetical protein [Candidatus Gracilibacteria bacterium]